MSHYLTEKPVILSNHKINVIAHGRPLSPIGSIRSISPYVSPRTVKSTPDKGRQHAHSLPNFRTASTISTTEYQKTAQENLLSISNNLSNMLQETFSGIDNICQKVRLCLIENNALSSPESQHYYAITKSRVESKLSVCEEENEVLESKGRSVSDSDHMINVAEIVEESVDDKEDDYIKTVEQETIKKPRRSKSLTPFFTLLNPTTFSAESVGVKSMSSKLMLSRKCTAENLKKSMKEVAKLSNYENFLTTMVDDINKEIEQCYSHCQKMGGDMNVKKSNKKSKRPKSSPSKQQNDERQNKDIEDDAKDMTGIKKLHITEEHFSETDLFFNCSVLNLQKRHPILMSEKTDFTYADVYRKRAITNLHGRMHAQLEANDSLIFFQKLMAKNRKNLKKNGSQNSLRKSKTKQPAPYLVNQKGVEKSASTKKSLTEFLNKKYQDSLWFKQQGKRARKEKYKQKKFEKIINKTYLTKNYSVHSSFSLPSSKQSKRSTSKSKGSCNSLNGTPCNCAVSVTNNQPLSNSERCRIHWMRTKYSQLSQKRLKYLDILDDISAKDLLPFNAEYPRKDDIHETSRNVKNSYLYQMMYGQVKEQAWAELILPITKESNEEVKNDEVPEQTPTEKSEVIRKLSKYIFSHSQSRSYTVMPVHVFYDNPRVNNGLRRSDIIHQKLPLPPMKETKEVVKKAEWNADLYRKHPRAMKVVYDPILRKIEKEIRIASVRQEKRQTSPTRINVTNSWSPKNFRKFCSPYKLAAPSVDSPRMSYNEQSLNIPLNKPVKTAPEHPKPIEVIKEAPPTPSLNARHPVVPPLWNIPEFETQSFKKDSMKKIQKDLDQQITKSKTEKERKIWENKYGKSVGQKLLNFIEKQPNVYQTPVPKYALPKTVKDTNRQKQMLDQLLNLKQKNDDIQVNIQKAIGVIEQKMVDILGKPANQGVEAFDQMEKEISDVLSLMKTNIPSRRISHHDKIDEYCSDLGQISDELFIKLDKILESPVLTSDKSERNSSKSKKRTKTKTSASRTQTGENMNQVCFSSTSASGEEKFTVTGISPRRSSKSPIRLLNSSPNADIDLSSIQKLRDEIKAHTLKNIDESKEEKAKKAKMTRTKLSKSLDKNDIKPVVEQVVNLAFCSVTKNGSAGDQPDKLDKSDNKSSTDNNAEEDKSTYSKANGDSASPADCDKSVDEPVKQTEERVEAVEKVEASESEKASENTLIANENAALEANKEVESAEQYFTPVTSPIFTTRNPELEREPLTPKESRILEEPEIESSKVEDVISEESLPKEVVEDKSESVALSLSENSDNDSATSLDKDEFYKNVTRIITRVETVYSQLDEFEEILAKEEEQTNPPKIAVFQESLPKKAEIPPDTFLTPFMHDVKNLRQSSNKSTPRMCKSPSFFNVINLLDNLTDIKEEKPVEIYTARVLNSALKCHIPQTLHFSWIQNPISYSTTEILKIPVKKKSGCLKKPSSHLNMNTSPSKSRQKVSFFLHKEHKASQVSVCPVHSKMASSDNSTSTSESYQSKRDQEVSACLNAQESKSVDNIMSLNEDVTLQTSTEYSEEIDKFETPMPEQVVPKVQENIQKNDENESANKKNVVEIFRSSNSDDDSKEKIKVFHDNFVSDRDVIKQCLKGFYNDHCITRAKNSQNQDLIIKKRDSSVDKLVKYMDPELLYNEIQKEASLLQPPKDVSHFIDSNLLKEAIIERRNLRLMKTRSLCLSLHQKISQDEILDSSAKMDGGSREGIIKGIYAFVYLLMFTALNLEYRCVQL